MAPNPEMISGPDLGGGFLHQLTRQGSGAQTQFVFHAQVGGQDAGSPAKGSPEPLGWSHPASPCQFGGPQCWHRDFLLPASEEGRVRASYNRTRFVFQAEMSALYGTSEPPVALVVEEVDTRIGPVLERAGIPWHWGGSVSAWLRGVPLTPNDVDLGTTVDGVAKIGEVLEEYLVEPVAPTHWPGGRTIVGARAYVGTMVRGMRVEWGVDQGPSTEGPFDLEWRIPEEQLPVDSVERNAHRYRVSRLEFALGRAVVQHRPERIVALVERLKQEGPDLGLLRRVFEAARVDDARAEPIMRTLSPR